MGQNTLGDHMHIQSIRSRHRACNYFPPLLDALLINARTVPALSESNSLHPAQEVFGIITQATKASHNKRVSNSILVCRGFLVFVFLGHYLAVATYTSWCTRSREHYSLDKVL